MARARIDTAPVSAAHLRCFSANPASWSVAFDRWPVDVPAPSRVHHVQFVDQGGWLVTDLPG